MSLKVTEKRFYRYLYLRLTRQRGSAHDLSFSVAIGVFFGFITPIFQMFFAILFAWIFRVNKVVAATCTWVSNPLTYAILFPVNLYLGSFFIKTEFNLQSSSSISLSTLFKDFKSVLSFFASDGMLMFMIGGSIFGAVVASLCYVSVYYSVNKHRKNKNERFLKRRQSLKKKVDLAR